jgi:Phosphotransferase enzyme family
MQPVPSVLDRVKAIVGAVPITWRSMSKGHTAAECWVMQFENGSTAFVKHATDDQTAESLTAERRICELVRERFLPKFIGWDDHESPILVLEDVSAGQTAPPWSQEYIDRVFYLLDTLAAMKMPENVPALANYPEPFNGWQQIARDRYAFSELGLVSAEWLDHALPELVEAEIGVDLGGNSLVHTDMRSDNICFHQDRTILVDWSWACRGNPKFDLISWLPSVHAEGGPPPWEFTVDEPELIAMQAGYLANRASRPPIDQDASIRQLQLAQLRSALPWAAKALGIEYP